MIQELTKEVLRKCLDEIKKEENKKKIDEYLVNPLITNISNRLYPYVLGLFTMYILTLVLVIVILTILIINKDK